MRTELSPADLIRRVLWLLLIGAVVGIFLFYNRVPSALPVPPATSSSVMGTPVEMYTATAIYVQSLATAKADQGGALMTQAANRLSIDLANQQSTRMAVQATQAAATEQYLLQAGFPPDAGSTQEAFFIQATETAQTGAMQSMRATQTQAAAQAATSYPPTATSLAITQSAAQMRAAENASQLRWNQDMRGLFEYGLLGMLALVTVGVIVAYRQLMPVIVHNLDVELSPTLTEVAPGSAIVPVAAPPPAEVPEVPPVGAAPGGPAPVILVVEPEKVKVWIDEAEQNLLHPGGE